MIQLMIKNSVVVLKLMYENKTYSDPFLILLNLLLEYFLLLLEAQIFYKKNV